MTNLGKPAQMTDGEVQPNNRLGGGVTRRRFLVTGAQAAALATGSGGLLTACGSKASATTARPKRGGTIRVGLLTGGTAETLVPASAAALPDLARSPQIFDLLFRVGNDIKTLVPMLAISAHSNRRADLWRLRLRSGVRWHDGKPFTADDVVWTVRSWASPLNLSNGEVAGVIDFTRVRKLDPLTVEIPLLTPVAQFPSLLTFQNFYVIPNGATSKTIQARPVGTGPFKFVSFTPGQQSVFTANADYWEHGKPYVERLVIDSSYTDETARQNALLSGAIDVAANIPGVIAKQFAHSGQVTLQKSPGGDANIIFVRVDKAPFADSRVRQALRLIADRPALVSAALDGYGTVGNDLQGVYTQYFASEFSREQDLEQARSLLKAAGHDGLTFSLPVANVFAGAVASATTYASQARAAGVNVVLQQQPAAGYFSKAGGYLARSTGLDTSGQSFPSLSVIYRVSIGRGAPYNDTHWGFQPRSAPSAALQKQAIAATDPAKAAELWHDVQKVQFDQGGYIVWGNADYLDAISTSVRGLRTTPAGFLNNWRLLDGWVA